MAVNSSITATTFTDKTSMSNSTKLLVKATHLSELQSAVNKLATYVKNVDNCGNCTPNQTQQANQTKPNQSCQTTACQAATKNQSCQQNQACQAANSNICQR